MRRKTNVGMQIFHPFIVTGCQVDNKPTLNGLIFVQLSE